MPTVSVPACLASSATTGAAPEPVPPPMPAVTKTMSTPRTCRVHAPVVLRHHQQSQPTTRKETFDQTGRGAPTPQSLRRHRSLRRVRRPEYLQRPTHVPVKRKRRRILAWLSDAHPEEQSSGAGWRGGRARRAVFLPSVMVVSAREEESACTSVLHATYLREKAWARLRISIREARGVDARAIALEERCALDARSFLHHSVQRVAAAPTNANDLDGAGRAARRRGLQVDLRRWRRRGDRIALAHPRVSG